MSQVRLKYERILCGTLTLVSLKPFRKSTRNDVCKALALHAFHVIDICPPCLPIAYKSTTFVDWSSHRHGTEVTPEEEETRAEAGHQTEYKIFSYRFSYYLRMGLQCGVIESMISIL